MRILKFFLHIAVFSLLTLITQVGGIIYLIHRPIAILIEKKYQSKRFLNLIKLFSFIFFYLTISLFIIPPLAKQFGRVRLPLFASENIPLQPRNIGFCLLNRTYVKPELRKVIIQAARDLGDNSSNYKGTIISYLDSGFPFFDGFPLPPHLSHNDGKKIDIALIYNDAQTQSRVNTTPSPIGYGVCEEPQIGEQNRPAECEEKGYYWYDFMRKHVVSQANKKDFSFDEAATATFIRLLAANKSVDKILIEPHLKTRLGLSDISKIRLHGCQAVRHDDHIQL